MTNLSCIQMHEVHVVGVSSIGRTGDPDFETKHTTHRKNENMKMKSILTIITGLLVSSGFAFAQAADTGRCGLPRGTCGNECDGSGFMNQDRGKGNGQGLRRGNRDGSGRGDQQRQRRRDGSGPGCNGGNRGN